MHVSVVNDFYVRGNTFGRLQVFFFVFFLCQAQEGRRAGGQRVRRLGEKQGGVVSVSRLPELRRRDGRDALVRLGRGHKAGQAGALV